MNLEIRKMTSVNVPTLVRGHGAGGPDLTQGTGDQRAGHDGDHIQGTGGSPKVRDGGDLGPERKTAAVGQGRERRRRSQRSDQRRPRKVTAALGGLEALAGGTAEAAVHLALLGGSRPDLHRPDVIKKRRRRTRIGKKTVRERGGRTGIESEKNANAPLVKRRRAKTRSGSETASQTVRREMLR